MTKMLNSENLLGDSGLEPHSTPTTADKILYNYAIEQCQAAALDELFGNPEECFQVGVIFFDFFIFLWSGVSNEALYLSQRAAKINSGKFVSLGN